MRKKEREIRDRAAIESILREAPVCRIGLCLDDTPYVVPMNFAYVENHIYLHSAREGKKMSILKKNNRVCFEVDERAGILQSEEACGWGMEYDSVIGFGKASLIEIPQEKKKALDLLMEKYSGILTWEYPQSQLDKVAIIRIDIDEMTGKHSSRLN